MLERSEGFIGDVRKKKMPGNVLLTELCYFILPPWSLQVTVIRTEISPDLLLFYPGGTYVAL